jgi:hypothetical protein
VKSSREIIVEFLLELVIEVLGEALFAIAGAVLQEAISDEDQAQRVPAAVGHVLMGCIAGAVSLVILQRQVVPYVGPHGFSLIIAPVATGALLECLGRWWVRRDNVRMALFTFRGGFCFAFGMAVVRFAYFERAWTWL